MLLAVATGPPAAACYGNEGGACLLLPRACLITIRTALVATQLSQPAQPSHALLGSCAGAREAGAPARAPQCAPSIALQDFETPETGRAQPST